MVGLAVVLGAEKERNTNFDLRTRPCNPVQFGDDGIEFLKMLENMRAENELKVILRKRPRMLIQIRDRVATVVDDVKIRPSLTYVSPAANIELSRSSRITNARCYQFIFRHSLAN